MNLQLNLPNNKLNYYVKAWLVLAISALAVAGLFSLPPVVLRGTYFADKLPIEEIFATSLVIHVDLSVYVWMFAIGGVLWTLFGNIKHLIFLKSAFWVSALGALAIVLSPFIADPSPLKNNYIPVLQNVVFFIGLGLFASGIIILSFTCIFNFKNNCKNIYAYALFITALINLIAFISFILSKMLVSKVVISDISQFYEHVFWGGGHVIQITYTSLLLIVWLVLAKACNPKLSLNKTMLYFIMSINLIVALSSLIFYMISDDIDEIYHYFTMQMRHGGGIAALILGAIIFFSVILKNSKENKHIKSSLIFSIILFGYGGLLGFMISGTNVTIPAHYHGSIVGITLAFIGVVYYLLPQAGFGEVKKRVANCQIFIYALGQMMHVTGLAWMGGYGALRKAPGTSGQIDNLAAKLMFFSGGSLAILGGLLFVIIALMAVFSSKTKIAK